MLLGTCVNKFKYLWIKRYSENMEKPMVNTRRTWHVGMDIARILRFGGESPMSSWLASVFVFGSYFLLNAFLLPLL
jgi:hypothetical protein